MELPGTVLVIDRHPLTRNGLRDVVAAAARDLSVRTAAMPDQAAPAEGPLVGLYNANTLAPDDPRVAGDLRRLQQLLPGTPLVLLSPQVVGEPARLGLRGHVLPSFTPEILVAALRLVLAGGSYFPPADQTAPRREPRRSLSDLTQREAEVLGKLCQGKANKIIAYELAMSENTVKVHVYRIMKKLGAGNRTEVVSLVQHQRTPPPAWGEGAAP